MKQWLLSVYSLRMVSDNVNFLVSNTRYYMVKDRCFHQLLLRVISSSFKSHANRVSREFLCHFIDNTHVLIHKIALFGSLLCLRYYTMVCFTYHILFCPHHKAVR